VLPDNVAVHPAAAVASADAIKAVNTAVVGWFDSTAHWLSTLPASPIREFLSGALLLTRRTLFNQLPTVHPNQYLQRANGQVVGSLGVVDAEGDPITYKLADAPQDGTVQIASDGTFTYTPGLSYVGSDTFTVAVNNSGFNLLDPFGSRTTTVPVHVYELNNPPAGTIVGYTRGYNIVNLTGQPIKVIEIREESNYEGSIEGAPRGIRHRPRRHRAL